MTEKQSSYKDLLAAAETPEQMNMNSGRKTRGNSYYKPNLRQGNKDYEGGLANSETPNLITSKSSKKRVLKKKRTMEGKELHEMGN